MNVIGYVRVSTDRQVDDGLGIDVQTQQIKAWAKMQSHSLIGLSVDKGVSGSKELGNRPSLLEAFSRLRDSTASALVVYRLDRLARDLIVQEQLLAEVWRLGGQAFSTSDAEAMYLTNDSSDPSRRLIRQVLGAVSEYERSMISLRLQSGRAQKHAQGGFAYGSPPFGFRSKNRELIVDVQEQSVINRIVALRNKGYSLRSIAFSLSQEQATVRRGGTWHPEAVRRILQRSTAI